MIGTDTLTDTLSDADVQRLLAESLDPLPLDGKRLVVIIPDGTRTAPIPLMFRLLYERLGARVERLDYLIALGTHPPMPEDAIERLVGVSAAERAARYPKSRVFNHQWDNPDALTTIGTIAADDAAGLTGGLLSRDVPVRLNRLIFEYDQIVICGPVFPHEVVGFSGGAKYLFPGIAGAEIIDFTHWLGALVTSMRTIGVKDTPIRRVIHRAATFVDKPILCVAMVLKGHDLHGLYVGPHAEAWSAAADLSARLNIVTVARPFRSVLAMPALIYDDLWTAAKAMYKTEPAIADGGEVIIYAPHITEVSYTHGRLLDQVGYHVRDYFTLQPGRFDHIPGSILAHSSHVKGAGEYDPATGVETPRISVTLATGIPEARCRQINLGYADYRTIDPQQWANRESEGLLLVPHAGEMLYRAIAPELV
ncbi:MAG TPA: lactate racemase domain-containing protein [Roseiflexaceae bacterium]|nr:lactate racemase domain-containing protein [Roseiflexaceae bacterium]